MTEKERAFLDDLQAVCKKHNVDIFKNGFDNLLYFVGAFYEGSYVVEIPITEALLEE